MSPRTRDADARSAILSAALELVEDGGHERLTIEGIAVRAGVGKTTIYRWWPSKDAVLLDAFVEAVAREGLATPPATHDLRADLRALLATTIEGLLRFDEPYRALLAAMQRDSALAGAIRERLLGPSLGLARERLARAQADGAVADDIDLDLAVELLVAPVFHRWALGTRPLVPGDGAALADLVLRAIGR